MAQIVLVVVIFSLTFTANYIIMPVGGDKWVTESVT